MKRRHKMQAKTKGFTLLEVMVALVIFGVCALAILEQTSRSIHQQAHLEDKTLALWIVENTFASLRLQANWPNTGTSETTVTFGQREWSVQQQVGTTTNPMLRKITLHVSRKSQSNKQPSPLVSLNGFMGEH